MLLSEAITTGNGAIKPAFSGCGQMKAAQRNTAHHSGMSAGALGEGEARCNFANATGWGREGNPYPPVPRPPAIIPVELPLFSAAPAGLARRCREISCFQTT